MKILLNKLAIILFSVFTKLKGYKFSIVKTQAENIDSDNIFDEGGYKLPETFQEEMQLYKANTIKFIAYYKSKPVGTVSLADPNIINRPYRLHGFDEKGEHFEIQSLVVSKGHR